MKKLSVRLSLLCMIAVLLIPFAGCKKDETAEETPAVSSDVMATSEPVMTSEPMMSTTDMSTDTTTSEPMVTDTPPAGQ